MLDARRLRILREVAACGTIAGAAAALHLTPSAVSQQLAALERESGDVLLERRGRGVVLTPAGRVLVEHAHLVIAALERAEADLAALREGPVGLLRARTFATAGIALVAPALAVLAARYPALRVETSESEAGFDLNEVLAGNCDVALTLLRPDGPAVDDPGLAILPILDDPYDAALPVGHVRAGRGEVDLAHLAGERWVLPLTGSAWEANVRLACAGAGFAPAPAHRAGDYGLALALVGATGCVTLVPRLAQVAVPSTVVIRRLAPPGAARRVIAIVRRGAEAQPAVAAFVAALRAQVGARSAVGSEGARAEVAAVGAEEGREDGDGDEHGGDQERGH